MEPVELPQPEVTVTIEHLNAGQLIDDVEMVVSIDGYRPGLVKSAIDHAGASPNLFQLPQTCWLWAAAGQASGSQRTDGDPAKLSPVQRLFNATTSSRTWGR